MPASDITKSGGVSGAQPVGGGNPPSHILRPNLALINSLRGSRPAITPPMRPQEIRRIAVIDDEAIIVRLLLRTLNASFSRVGLNVKTEPASQEITKNHNGPIIVTATTSDEIATAASSLVRWGIDFTFTDFNMPDTTGNTIIRQMRLGRYGGFFVGMTGRPVDNTEPFYQAGADAVIEKPFNVEPKQFFVL